MTIDELDATVVAICLVSSVLVCFMSFIYLFIYLLFGKQTVWISTKIKGTLVYICCKYSQPLGMANSTEKNYFEKQMVVNLVKKFPWIIFSPKIYYRIHNN
jgi:hypothetical protein